MNYNVSHVDNPSKCKVIHVNNVRKYRVRDENVCALTAVAEGDVLEENCVQLFEDKCNNYNEEVFMAVLSSFDDVLCEQPSKTDVVSMSITVKEDEDIVSQPPNRILERSKSGVKDEIDKVLDADIIEPSTSLWAGSHHKTR